MFLGEREDEFSVLAATFFIWLEVAKPSTIETVM